MNSRIDQYLAVVAAELSRFWGKVVNVRRTLPNWALSDKFQSMVVCAWIISPG